MLKLIAGPCVIENLEQTYQIAKRLKEITDKLDVDFTFKASYDKANRTSINSFRGIGFAAGLGALSTIKNALDIPVTSDVHNTNEIDPASKVLDIIQIPAFLCRQTDIILEAATTQKELNIKKGQFMSPWDVTHIIDKARSVGNYKVNIIERGSSFGYDDVVIDIRMIARMKRFGCKVIVDVSHSSGHRDNTPALARAAVAAGADGIFIETHPDPEKALCDGNTSLDISELEDLLIQLIKIKEVL